MDIHSLQNPRIKHLVKLRRRHHRDESGQMLIEGYRELRRAADQGLPVDAVYHCADFFLGENEQDLIDACAASGAESFACSPEVFKKISYRDRPDGLIALAPRWPLDPDAIALPDCPLILLCEGIEKPGNLGTMLRSADAAGADAVMLCDTVTDCFNPNVIRASVGTVFSMPLAEFESTSAAMDWLRARGIQVVATSPDAEQSFHDADLRPPTAVLVGPEQYGLAEASLAGADLRVRIPMKGHSDSLNVAASATLMLYEVLRQRSGT